MEHFVQKATANVERFLGDIDEQALNDADLFYEEVYTLAHDGAVDAGATVEQAREIAEKICSQY
jgi:hypothetical protein